MPDNSEPRFDPDDTWGRAVSMVTGYPMPSRKALFDSLAHDDGTPQFRVSIEGVGVRGGITPADVGWGVSDGEDYNIPFYTAGGDGEHSGNVKMREARFVLIGGPPLQLGAGGYGAAWTGGYGNEWDSTPKAQYIAGAGHALRALAEGAHTTRDHGDYNGGIVADANGVDLGSFERVAQAFDRSKQFLVDHAATLNTWETALGGDDAAWSGQAAGVFRNLLHTLRTNYDGYVEQMGGADYQGAHQTLSGYVPRSVYGDAMAQAQQVLHGEAVRLSNAWNAWTHDPNYVHDPLHAVLTMLDRVAAWVWQHNLTQVVIHGGRHLATTAAFRENLALEVPELGRTITGSLRDESMWREIGHAAVDLWNLNVNNMLVPTAEIALSNLNNSWADISSILGQPVETNTTSSLVQQAQMDQAAQRNAQAQRVMDNLNDQLGQQNVSGFNSGDLGLGGGGGEQPLNNPVPSSNPPGNLGLGGGVGDQPLNNPVPSSNPLGNLGELPDSAGSDGSPVNNQTSAPPASGPQPILPLNPATSPFPLSQIPTNTNTGQDRSPITTLPDLALNTGTITNPDGSITSRNSDGTLVTTNRDGSVSRFNPDTGTVTTTTPDDNETVTNLNSNRPFTNADGSISRLNSDGTLTNRFPDGTITTINPETGSVSIADPDGNTSRIQLNPPSTGDSGDGVGLGRDGFDVVPINRDVGLGEFGGSGGLGRDGDGVGLGRDGSDVVPINRDVGLGDLGGSGGSGGDGAGLGGRGSDAIALNSTDADVAYDEYDDNSASSGGPIGGRATSDATSSVGPVPLNPGTPGMPMGGMPMGGMPMGGGGMGGAGQQSSNERVRNVLTDPDDTTPQSHRGRLGGRPAAADEEDLVHIRRRNATSSSVGPDARTDSAVQGSQNTQSSSGRRADWVPEEEDVWGIDEGGTPAAIGR
ncbi:AAWKG family protein [Streptomyces sp. NPDC020681]|uniref:AAWKG family protein n=1 Tax=Streptomyces sp. NPDC020681 TaxID=3365083 RepID=UPI0037B4D647